METTTITTTAAAMRHVGEAVRTDPADVAGVLAHLNRAERLAVKINAAVDRDAVLGIIDALREGVAAPF